MEFDMFFFSTRQLGNA